ncbi:MAG: hypothetical protein AB7N73_14500 [Gemmatimonadales bacterium]
MRTRRFLSFTVPAGAGSYATEVLYLRQQNDEGAFDFLQRVAVYVAQLPASCAIEVDLLKADSANAKTPASTDWLGPALNLTAVGLNTTLTPAGWYGARIRAKSGGTAGTALVHTSWTDEA